MAETSVGQQHQKEQGGGNKNPVGEKCRRNQCAQAAQRVEDNPLYHAAPVANFVKHEDKTWLIAATIAAAAATAHRWRHIIIRALFSAPGGASKDGQ